MNGMESGQKSIRMQELSKKEVDSEETRGGNQTLYLYILMGRLEAASDGVLESNEHDFPYPQHPSKMYRKHP